MQNYCEFFAKDWTIVHGFDIFSLEIMLEWQKKKHKGGGKKKNNKHEKKKRKQKKKQKKKKNMEG